MKKLTILIMLLTASISAFGQPPKLLDPTNMKIYQKCSEVKAEGFNWWKCDSLYRGQLFTTLKPYTGLGNDDNMTITSTWEDSITKLVHVKYQQYYKSIPMEGVYYVEHSMNNIVLLSNGMLCENMNKDATPTVSESTALGYALNYVDADVYAWEDSLEYYLKHDSLSADTTYYPKGILMWAMTGNNTIIPNNFKLAWKFRIFAVDSPEIDKYIYVDAKTGAIVKDVNTTYHGTFNHIYYGNQTIDTRWYGGGKNKFFLEANDDGRNILTKDNKFDKSWKYHALPDDQDDNWGTSRWAATSSHWVVQKTWEYWKDVWKRNGMDNNWRPIKVLGNYTQSNAGYTQDKYGVGADAIAFGNFDIGLTATVDIAAHEFTHGVTRYTANFYSGSDQGALDESYSDIFGFLTERYVFGFRNWTIAEDASSIYVRNIQNPRLTTQTDPCLPTNYPTYYQEANCWYSGTCDEGGRHHNLAVQNQCFYFLAQGGTQLGITVSGIGIDKAAQIVAFALTNGLVLSGTTYVQNRESWVTAARILFGDCSNEQIQTCKAWAACNIGNPCPCSPPPVKWCWEDRFRYEQEAPTALKTKQVKEADVINLYPNPTNNLLTIDFNGLMYNELSFAKEVTLINMLGQKVKTQSIIANQQTITLRVGDLKAGTYLVNVLINGYSRQYKFVKS